MVIEDLKGLLQAYEDRTKKKKKIRRAIEASSQNKSF